MKKTLPIITATVLFALSGSLFAATVVTVNGVKIDSSDIARRTQNVVQNSNGQITDSPQLRQYIANELITEQLVVQEAKRLKIDKSSDYQALETEALKQIKEKQLDKQPNFKENWADYQNNLLMTAYAANILKQNPVTEAAVQQKYNQLKSRYDNTSEVQMGEIVTNKPADADAAIKELNNKKKFAEVASKYSMSQATKNSGGIVPDYVSLVDLKETNPLVYQAINQLNKGQFTPTPLKKDDVNLILYINDKRSINVPAFDQMKLGLMQRMEQVRLSEAIDALGKKANIVPAK